MVRIVALLLVFLIQDDIETRAARIRQAIKDLSSRNDKVVETAFVELHRQGAMSVPPMLNHMKEEETSDVHVAALAAILRKIAKAEAIVLKPEFLERALSVFKKRRSLKVREHMAAFLGYVEPSAGPLKDAVVWEVRRSEEFLVRSACVTSLGHIGSREDGGGLESPASKTTKILIDVFEKDPDVSVRHSVIPAIKRIGPKAILALPIVAKYAREERNPFEARLEAVATVGSFREVAADEAAWLKQMGERGEPMEIRIPAAAAAASVTGRMADYLKYLSDGLASRKYEVQVHSIRALADLESKAAPAVLSLRPLLEDLNGTLRHEAVKAMGRIGPAARSALPQLERLLKDSDLAIAEEAQTSIQMITKK